MLPSRESERKRSRATPSLKQHFPWGISHLVLVPLANTEKAHLVSVSNILKAIFQKRDLGELLLLDFYLSQLGLSKEHR